MSTILIADDDLHIRKAYKDLFEKEGFTVRLARSGAEAVAKFTDSRADLILLDVMMPNGSGLEACEEIRHYDKCVPILFVTAMPSEVSLVRGLGLGADDYIEKARPLTELVARVRAALRRAENHLAMERALDTPEPIELIWAGVTINLVRHEIKGSNFTDRLTPLETKLLTCLVEAEGRLCSYDDIFPMLYGAKAIGEDSSIRNLVMRLKKKLGPASDLIVSERGYGYALTPRLFEKTKPSTKKSMLFFL